MVKKFKLGSESIRVIIIQTAKSKTNNRCNHSPIGVIINNYICRPEKLSGLN